MITRRRFVIAGCAAVGGTIQPAYAQGPVNRMIRVAFLGAATPVGYATQVEALRAGLRDHGYVEGQNLTLEFRWAEGRYERLPELAAELVALKPDVIVTHATPGTRAAMRATSTIPIVMASNGDAVAQGLVASLARPGGNLTGSTFFQPELMAKRVELLQLAQPQLKRVAVLLNPANPTRDTLLRALTPAVTELGLALEAIDVERTLDLERALTEAVRRRCEGVVVRDDAMYITAAGEIARMTVGLRLSASGFKEFAERGGLIGYGVNFRAMFRRVGYFVDRIVKGVPPALIPVEQASKFELVVNMGTARALGLALPRRLLVRADRVIE